MSKFHADFFSQLALYSECSVHPGALESGSLFYIREIHRYQQYISTVLTNDYPIKVSHKSAS